MPDPTPPVGVLVDAYTSANYLPPAFSRLGAEVVHVQSTPAPIRTMTPPDLTRYRDALVHQDVRRTAELLARHSPVCVVAGQEPGVTLADELSEVMGLPTNGSALSAARRDKFVMIETLRQAGLRCAQHFKSADPEALVRWARDHGAYPFVVKPLRSAATDAVRVCSNAHEIRFAAKAVLSSPDLFGLPNDEALIQSYLAGTEFVVDMVVCEGQRYVCGIWQYKKNLVNGRNLYDQDVLISAEESPAPELISYVDAVLEALNIRFGPVHAEVMMTADGPALVEIATRMAGNMHPEFHDLCAGGNQAALTALAYLHPDTFLAKYGGRQYRKLLEAVCYTTPTTLSGVVESIDESVVRQIEGLETVFAVNVKLRQGDRIVPTEDLFTSTLRVFLTNPSIEAIERDYHRVGELKDHVYRLARSTNSSHSQPRRNR